MDRNPETRRPDIRNLLCGELDITREFEALLAEEYRCIAERDIAALERLINDKACLLERLATMEQERTRILDEAGFGTGNDAMSDYLRDCDPRQELAGLWNDLQSQARMCHGLNRKNQQLVDLCSRHAREILHLLRGEAPDQNTYQADGEAGQQHSSRSLARV